MWQIQNILLSDSILWTAYYQVWYLHIIFSERKITGYTISHWSKSWSQIMTWKSGLDITKISSYQVHAISRPVGNWRAGKFFWFYYSLVSYEIKVARGHAHIIIAGENSWPVALGDSPAIQKMFNGILQENSKISCWQMNN